MPRVRSTTRCGTRPGVIRWVPLVHATVALRAGFGGLMDAATGLLYVGDGQYGVYPELVEGIPTPADS